MSLRPPAAAPHGFVYATSAPERWCCATEAHSTQHHRGCPHAMSHHCRHGTTEAPEKWRLSTTGGNRLGSSLLGLAPASLAPALMVSRLHFKRLVVRIRDYGLGITCALQTPANVMLCVLRHCGGGLRALCSAYAGGGCACNAGALRPLCSAVVLAVFSLFPSLSLSGWCCG